jgi:DNA polymerase-3 subunit alpha
MYKQFRGLEAALENTVEIASRCNVELRPERDLHPRIPIPTGETSDSYLRRLAEEGLSARLEQLRRSGGNPDDEGYRKRLDHELEVLSGARCSDYYLVVWDLLRHSRQCGIPVGPGRGSSAGSLLAYALGITQPDPMRFGLLFERFYNSDLAGLPDFDLDLGHRRRDELIDYLGSLHGDSGVSRTMTYNCPSALQTLRDVGAVLGFTPRETAEFSRLVPRRGKGMGLGMEELLVEVSARREVRADSARNRQLFEMASLLDGRRLKATVSPASVVISDKPLLDVTPLCVGPGKQVASQFTKPQMESRGFLVLDLLGSRTLTFIDDILALIRRNRKNPPDLEMLPLDCPEVYELLSSGETRGVFSMESPDMRKFLRRLRPDRFQDIMAAVALCRPGPIGCGMTRSYVDRKRGEEPVDCRHQSLEPLLQDTYGLLVYQEQLMGLAALVAGFSMAKADRLRRGIMARPGSGMPELEGAFFLGGVKRGHSEPFLADLLDHMKQCGRYAYNKAHAASYGLLTYWTAFLRAGFPEEFAAVRRPR